MVLPPSDFVTPALLVGHSTQPTALAVVFIVLAIGLRFLQFRARGRRGGRGSWGGGSIGGGPRGGNGTGNDPPVQWDIRKPSEPEASQEPSSEEHNPPNDL